MRKFLTSFIVILLSGAFLFSNASADPIYSFPGSADKYFEGNIFTRSTTLENTYNDLVFSITVTAGSTYQAISGDYWELWGSSSGDRLWFEISAGGTVIQQDFFGGFDWNQGDHSTTITSISFQGLQGDAVQIKIWSEVTSNPREYWVNDGGDLSDLTEIIFITDVGSAVPVPVPIWLLASGLMCLVGFRRKFFNH